MKALSVRQPFAGLIVAGLKAVEYRSWGAAHRGPLLIHAGRSIDRQALAAAPALPPELLERGVLLGVVELVRIDPDGESGYAWHLARPRRLASPAPLRGRLGLFEVDDALVTE